MTYLCKSIEVPALTMKSPALLQRVQRDDLSIKDLADCLKLDPGLSIRLLRLSNSPFFGVSRQVCSVSEAVIVIGLNRTRALVLAELARSAVVSIPWKTFPWITFWQVGIRCASMCQLLANRVGFSESMAFTAGLFHNFGLLSLAQGHIPLYQHWLGQGLSGAELSREEEAAFNTNHALAGCDLLQSWNFSSQLCEAIAIQYDEADTGHADILAQMLQLVHMLSDKPDKPEMEKPVGYERVSKLLLARFDLAETDLPMFLETADEHTSRWIALTGAL